MTAYADGRQLLKASLAYDRVCRGHRTPGQLLLLSRALAEGRATQCKTQQRARQLEETVRDPRRRVEVGEGGRQQGRILPDEATLSKITRYEGHLSRQLLQALHTLERRQAARAGLPVTPPATLDVTVDAPAGATPVLQTTAEVA